MHEMKVLVTGAGGFLGGAVIAACQKSGNQVSGLFRPASPPTSEQVSEGVQVMVGDLRQKSAWCDALDDFEAVVHCAAAVSGDLSAQLVGTVLATENLLAALPDGIRRFVHVSSFSVYDFKAPGWRGFLDEKTPIEPDPQNRDAYTQTKILQEEMVRKYCRDHGIELVVIRPGAIYGPGKDWDFGRALKFGKFALIFAPLSRMRLTHVANCADAISAALTAPVKEELIVNIVDNEQPSHWAYHRLAKTAGATDHMAIPIPYWAVMGLGLSARLASVLFFKGKARLPEILSIPRQRVRWRQLRYGNSLAGQALNWQPKVSLAEGVAGLVGQIYRTPL
jgi:2-alkyl-3-oxoalkanoate reductase